MNITENVSLKDLVQSPLAASRGFQNLPNDLDLPNLIRLAHVIEECMKAVKPHTLEILSAYQVPRLTVALGADPRDQYSTGKAVDFRVMGMDLHAAMDAIVDAKVPFDSLESQWRRNGFGWLHLEIPDPGEEPERKVTKGVMKKGRVYLQ